MDFPGLCFDSWSVWLSSMGHFLSDIWFLKNHLHTCPSPDVYGVASFLSMMRMMSLGVALWVLLRALRGSGSRTCSMLTTWWPWQLMTQSNCRKCWDVWNRTLPGKDIQWMCRNPTKFILMRTKIRSFLFFVSTIMSSKRNSFTYLLGSNVVQ